MRHETEEYDVLSHFIPAIVNADKTGLDADESREMDEFIREAEEWAKRRLGYRSHHWCAGNENAGFGRCEISACFGERETLQLVIMFEPSERT